MEFEWPEQRLERRLELGECLELGVCLEFGWPELRLELGVCLELGWRVWRRAALGVWTPKPEILTLT